MSIANFDSLSFVAGMIAAQAIQWVFYLVIHSEFKRFEDRTKTKETKNG